MIIVMRSGIVTATTSSSNRLIEAEEVMIRTHQVLISHHKMIPRTETSTLQQMLLMDLMTGVYVDDDIIIIIIIITSF